MVKYTLDKYVIRGGHPLFGEVTVSGAKNAAVAILPASVLVKAPVRIENVPEISDVKNIAVMLEYMGATVKTINKTTLEIDTTHLKNIQPPYDMVRRLRASYYFIGALLGRFGEAHVAMPGGCDFGTRPIDQHIKGFEALSAEAVIGDGGIVNAAAHDGVLKGASVYLDVVSVGATMNIMIAAVLAEGTTVIENAAREPHIVDLANFLNACGADIRGAGTDTIKIKGVESLHGCTYSIIPDQIEAGTYMALVAATGGKVEVKNLIPKHMESITAKLEEMGVTVTELDDSIIVEKGPKRLNKINLKTMPYPGFPTDMQPQFGVLMCLAEGTSKLTEGVYDNRFKYMDELARMGANVSVDGRVAVIEGVDALLPSPMQACDLRAGAALVIAALAANGESEIDSIKFIERGYEDFVGKLSSLGAQIKKVSIPDGIVLDKAN